ncbi:MAG: hypothetical protein E7511_06515 [Ruminococcus sp.]|nr:hypothetical protein [Ruminococcus sp.]
MTFDFTFGNTHTTMELSTLIILAFVVGFFIWLICWSLCRGIRTLQGKPLNSPPSRLFWAKVTADVLDTEEDEIWHGIPEAFQAAHNLKTGASIGSHDGYMRRVQSCKVSYTYKERSYTSTIWNPVIRDGKTEIYCYKRKPALTKVYIPNQSWSKGAGIFMLFFGILMILMGVIAICGIFS